MHIAFGRHCRTATRLIAISRYADQLVEFGVDGSDRVIPNGICPASVGAEPSQRNLLVLASIDVTIRGIDQLQRRWLWRGVRMWGVACIGCSASTRQSGYS